jgi:hypothetical protein
VVLMPGRPGDWRPLGGWTVRVTSEGSPPYVALEVEQAPQQDASALQELTMLLQRLGTAVARLEDRPAALAHLTGHSRPPDQRPPEPRRRGLLTGAWALAMAALAGTAVLLCPPPPEPSGAKHPPALATPAPAEPFTFIAMQDEDGNPSIIGHPMPDGPIKGQQKPPCKVPSVELRGGCWVQLAHKPPCPVSTAEHEGACYMPVSEKKPEPRALMP